MKKIILLILSVLFLFTACVKEDESLNIDETDKPSYTDKTGHENQISKFEENYTDLLKDYVFSREDIKPENIRIHFDETEDKVKFLYSSFMLGEKKYLSLSVFYDGDIKACEYKELNLSDKIYMNNGYIDLSLKGKFPDGSGEYYYFTAGYVINEEIASVVFNFNGTEFEKVSVVNNYFACLESEETEVSLNSVQIFDNNNKLIK